MKGMEETESPRKTEQKELMPTMLLDSKLMKDRLRMPGNSSS